MLSCPTVARSPGYLKRNFLFLWLMFNVTSIQIGHFVTGFPGRETFEGWPQRVTKKCTISSHTIIQNTNWHETTLQSTNELTCLIITFSPLLTPNKIPHSQQSVKTVHTFALWWTLPDYFPLYWLWATVHVSIDKRQLVQLCPQQMGKGRRHTTWPLSTHIHGSCA